MIRFGSVRFYTNEGSVLFLFFARIENCGLIRVRFFYSVCFVWFCSDLDGFRCLI
jgi:hypothetical protein